MKHSSFSAMQLSLKNNKRERKSRFDNSPLGKTKSMLNAKIATKPIDKKELNKIASRIKSQNNYNLLKGILFFTIIAAIISAFVIFLIHTFNTH